MYKDGDGIYINGKKITALSGAYSTVYLKPKESVIPALKNADLDLPLFLLLGDKHYTKKGICINCTCTAGSCINCRCTIDDPTFLRDLDKLANDNHPIDFFTELFFRPIESDRSLGVSEYFNTPEFRSCYDRTKKGTSDDSCPTKNIRWQFGDVRQSIFYPKYQTTLEASFVAIDDFFQGKIEYISYITDESLELLLELNSIVQSGSDEKKDDSDSDGVIDTDRFAKRFFQLADNYTNPSLVVKQMHKQSYMNLRDKNYMSRVLRKGLDYIIDDKQLEPLFASGQFNEMIRMLRGWMEDYRLGNDISRYFIEYSNQFDTCARIMGNINTIWLDMYFILRSLKAPEGNSPTNRNNSSLTVAFFGHDHIRTISYLLSHVMGLYDLIIERPRDQCTRIRKKINLDKDLEFHNNKRDELPNEYDDESQQYFGRLSRCYKSESPKMRRKKIKSKTKSHKKCTLHYQYRNKSVHAKERSWFTSNQ